jgi:hypothetical protein
MMRNTHFWVAYFLREILADYEADKQHDLGRIEQLRAKMHAKIAQEEADKQAEAEWQTSNHEVLQADIHLRGLDKQAACERADALLTEMHAGKQAEAVLINCRECGIPIQGRNYYSKHNEWLCPDCWEKAVTRPPDTATKQPRKPKVGDVVHWVNLHGDHRPAIVMEFAEASWLAVIGREGDDLNVFSERAHMEESMRPHTWHWPEDD